MSTVLPTHYRDDDGPWCPFSGCTSTSGTCPNGCAGALEHYANDGHTECATDTCGAQERHKPTGVGLTCERTKGHPGDHADATSVGSGVTARW